MDEYTPSIFPCKKCVVLACCSKACDKLKTRNRDAVSQILKTGICPDCGSKTIYRDCRQLQYFITCSECKHKFEMMGDWVMNRYL